MRLDTEIIEGRLDIIERNLSFLEEYKTLSPDEFTESYRDTQAAKYSLLEIMESCMDIANYIISVMGFRRAEGYSDIFKVLGEEDVLDEELSIRLENMARFRNLLVHRYGELDDRRVLEIIKENLTDIKEFEKQIQKFVKHIEA
ncbi:MAG: type VII toxin-antitoxin system HepT family RNase toxin [Candidatus Bathyarchaeia archaeon]